jgi:putative Holliday junction resolvase
LVDERLSTVQAAADLRAAGRSSKNQRHVIDQAAAVILLQHAVDSEKARGVPPGRLLALKGNNA